MKQSKQHGGWVFSVYYSSPTHWNYQATKEALDRQAKGEVKAFDAAQAMAAVVGLIDSHNLNETELKEKI